MFLSAVNFIRGQAMNHLCSNFFVTKLEVNTLFFSTQKFNLI